MGLVQIDRVEPLPGHCLRLTLLDGSVVERSVAHLLVGPAFEAIRLEPGLFDQARVEGGTVVWPGGGRLALDVLLADPTPFSAEALSAARATTLDEIVRSFEDSPRSGSRFAPSEAALQRWHIRSVPLPLPFYLSPTLVCTSSPRREDRFCHLISAPAAVGKTTLASHLHDRLVRTGRTVLYVPLQHATIGDRYLAGLLSDSFPTTTKQQLYQSLFGGSMAILFDGYDEVSMTTWQIDMNRRFIEEVVETFQSHCPAVAAPCLVFLYRSVFSETGIFDALLPHAAHYRVEFFNRSQQREYLRLYLESKGDAGKPFVPLVDQFLAGFEQRASAASPQAEAFFGHAIVLSSFGDFLLDQDERNVFRLAKELAAERVDEAASTGILRGIIDGIIRREAGKFSPQESLRPLARFEPFDPDFQETLISELAAIPGARVLLEHARDLADRLGREKLAACPDFANLTEPARDAATRDYLENLRKKLEMHPFVDTRGDRLAFRNPIYQEYYLARFIAKKPSVQRCQLIPSAGSSSWYLALFLLAHIPNRDLTPYSTAVFSILQLLASACGEQDYQIAITYESSSSSWVVQIESENLCVAPFYVGRDPVLTLELPADGVLANFTIDGQDEGQVSVTGPPGYETKSPILLCRGVLTGAEVEIDAVAATFDAIAIHTGQLTLSARVADLQGVDRVTVTWKDGPNLQSSEYARNRWGEVMAAPALNASSREEFQNKVRKLLLWFRSRLVMSSHRFSAFVLNKGRDIVLARIVDFFFQSSILQKMPWGSGVISPVERVIELNRGELVKYDVVLVGRTEWRFGPGFDRLFSMWQAFDRDER